MNDVMAGQNWSFGGKFAKYTPVDSNAPTPEEIIAQYELRKASEAAHAARNKLVADAHTDPKIVDTFRAIAWAKSGHAVRLVPPASPNDAWDFLPESIPAGWPESILDPVAHVASELARRGIKAE